MAGKSIIDKETLLSVALKMVELYGKIGRAHV